MTPVPRLNNVVQKRSTLRSLVDITAIKDMTNTNKEEYESEGTVARSEECNVRKEAQYRDEHFGYAGDLRIRHLEKKRIKNKMKRNKNALFDEDNFEHSDSEESELNLDELLCEYAGKLDLANEYISFAVFAFFQKDDQ